MMCGQLHPRGGLQECNADGAASIFHRTHLQLILKWSGIVFRSRSCCCEDHEKNHGKEGAPNDQITADVGARVDGSFAGEQYGDVGDIPD